MDVKIVFGKVAHIVVPDMRNNAGKGFLWERKFHLPF